VAVVKCFLIFGCLMLIDPKQLKLWSIDFKFGVHHDYLKLVGKEVVPRVT